MEELGTKDSSVYLGDLYCPSQSSYIEVEVVRGDSGWHTFHSKMFSQSDEETTDGGVSLCGGQFQQALDSITSLALSYSGTLSGTIFIEIHPNVDN